MPMFRKQIKTASVKRQAYTGTTYKKSWYIAISNTYKWHLKALTIKDGIEMDMFWKSFQFTTNIDADIKQADKVTIDWIEYNVTGVQDFWGITFNTKKVLLTKEI